MIILEQQEDFPLSRPHLNLTKFLDSPYGQFLATLSHGSESRENLEVHVKTHYDALRDLVKNGIQVETPNGDLESFNVVVFLVTDAGLLKDILGKCATNGLFGCPGLVATGAKRTILTGQKLNPVNANLKQLLNSVRMGNKQ